MDKANLSLHRREEVVLFPSVCRPAKPDLRELVSLQLPSRSFDIVSSAYKDEALLPIKAWVFRHNYSSSCNYLLNGLSKVLFGGCRGSHIQKVYDSRARAFFELPSRDTELKVSLGGEIFDVGKSGRNGHLHSNILFPRNSLRDLTRIDSLHGSWIPIKLFSEEGIFAHVDFALQMLDTRGISVISDVDDTVMFSDVSNKRSLIQNTFVKDFAAVPGMCDVYRAWAFQGAQFHYIFSTPWQLFKPLKEFLLNNGFPMGSFHLKTFSWRDFSWLDIVASPEKTKPPALLSLLNAFPLRKFVLIGDSSEKDPEIYANLLRRYQDRIAHVFIRHTDASNNQDIRYEQVFSGISSARWSVFESADEISKNLERIIRKSGLENATEEVAGEELQHLASSNSRLVSISDSSVTTEVRVNIA